MQLGDYIGEESFDTEYKLYVENNKCSFFSNDEIVGIYEDKQPIPTRKHNNMTIQNTKNLLVKYLPKYTSNFSQAKINGKLYLGVSDDGIVEGIPYFGNIQEFVKDLDINNIMTQIDKCIRIRNMSHEQKSNWLNENVIVECKELDVNEYLAIDDHWKDRLIELQKEHQKQIQRWENYISKYKKWYQQVQFYSRKVNDLVNDTEIRKEMSMNNANSDRITALLSSPTQIVLLDEQFITDEELLRLLLVYKNIKLHEIQKQKPRRPCKKPQSTFNYINFSKMICNSRHLTYQQGAKFYLIEVSFKTFECEENISYYENKNWVARKRSVYNGNPCCIDL